MKPAMDQISAALGRNFYDFKICHNVQAQLEGDEWVINGQKSAWVSGGTIADCAGMCIVGQTLQEECPAAVYLSCRLILKAFSRESPWKKRVRLDAEGDRREFPLEKLPRISLE